MNLEVSIVGPCAQEGSLGFGPNTREFAVEVFVTDRDKVMGEEHKYALSQSTTRYTSSWSQPYLRVDAVIYGQSIALHDLEAKAKMLKRLFAYVGKLPVRPQTTADWVATIAALHRLASGRLFAYKDHRTRPEISDDNATVARMCHEVAKREQELVPEQAKKEV